MEKEALRNIELRTCDVPETQRGLLFVLWFKNKRNVGFTGYSFQRVKAKTPSISVQ